MNTRRPKQFVGLHAHSLSIFDSIDPPKEHIDFARENGMNSLALTDHGHMNGFALQNNYCIELKKKGVDFKPIFGCEAYFVESLSKWKEMKNEKEFRKQQQDKLVPGDVFGSQAQEVDEIREETEAQEKNNSSEEDGGTIIENEEETKSGVKQIDPLKERSHLVLLAKNNLGLKALFNMVSDSSSKGFYIYPRLDLLVLVVICLK